ncbi:MAG: 2-hydroxyglutaryl-CoA dehydratase [Proteobacteria bacterium]|nr:2-hydroxyglutaryl-CoA dehydratase [Pseudomonadota bacterium]MBU1742294.1 2-hydroxyglutaryl-CoA dehydratase [Pseudomonadota bacterium]
MKYFAGIDVGSLSTDVVIIDEGPRVVGYSIVTTGAKSTTAADKALAAALDRAGISRDQITAMIATGYGRVSVPLADKAVTEITCHGLGAHHLFPGTGTVIDVGGQDSKVIKVGPKGKVLDFNMNDKCAAGTGRFLEVMADKLEVGLDQMGPLSLTAKREIEISSVCTVFAESEVVSLVAQDEPVADIIRGLHRAIVNRIWNMVQLVGVNPEVTMTGGVAKNSGVVALLEDKIKAKINISDEPQIVGALGAALLARNSR